MIHLLELTDIQVAFIKELVDGWTDYSFILVNEYPAKETDDLQDKLKELT